MEELPQKIAHTARKHADDDLLVLRRYSRERCDILGNAINNLKASDMSSDDNEVPLNRIKKSKQCVKRFSNFDSDSGEETSRNGNISKTQQAKIQTSPVLTSDSESNPDILIRKPHKSRIQRNEDVSDPEEVESEKITKNEEQQLRMKNKRNKLRDKFKSLVTSREKEVQPMNVEDEVNRRSDCNSSASDEEMASMEKIKQKIKERLSFRPPICDPDTSDEESHQEKLLCRPKKERKMTKSTLAQPQRMSAKQAMENMQKIKSESNRMLREKEVSLPYHRPKALSLKDIMSRRKPALTSDGKVLPIKMNGEQLKQYARLLEERQKEMMELCKSESEEELNENSVEANTGITVNNVNENQSDGLICLENINTISTITDTKGSINDNMINEDGHTKIIDENLLTDKDTHIDLLTKEQDSETSMNLVYNDSVDSVDDDKLITDAEEVISTKDEGVNNSNHSMKGNEEGIHVNPTDNRKNENEDAADANFRINTDDSQLITLHLDTENIDAHTAKEQLTENTITPKSIEKENIQTPDTNNFEKITTNEDEETNKQNVDNEFSDDDINMEDIDAIIENAEIIKDIEDKVNTPLLMRNKPLNLNPKLIGAPGMVIDLDGTDPAPRKSGIELLKERFTFFAKLKTPEESQREREQKFKPGMQLKKLKLELEEKIAEQRSLEWAKRLEEDKEQANELKVLRGEESDDDDIDKIEIKDKELIGEPEQSESEEEELLEDDIVIKDKPRVKNAMVDDEAEESDCDEQRDMDANVEDNEKNEEIENEVEGDIIDGDNDDDPEENESETDESDESSESEDEQVPSTKKGRILKAFEDSDDEDAREDQYVVEMKDVKETADSKTYLSTVIDTPNTQSQVVSQDEELQLAQRPKSTSDELFTSQESASMASDAKDKDKGISENEETLTQTFSILDPSKQATAVLTLNNSGNLSGDCNTQSLEASNTDANFDIVCPIMMSQNNLPLPSQIPTTQLSQSQSIGENILALCTGQFYDNQFLSQLEENQPPQGDSQKYDSFDNYRTQETQVENTNNFDTISNSVDNKEKNTVDTVKVKDTDQFIELNSTEDNKENKQQRIVDDNLKSILDELADPEFDSPKPNKFFVGSKNAKKDTIHDEVQPKKKLIIDSDDETNETDTKDSKKRKKLKKKKPEQRALQFSDDEQEQSDEEVVEEYESDIQEDDQERVVEYDSEENEIEIKPQNTKKKRKMAEFFENEAELTSEDEWVGSGDEDEAGLDTMEREAGDDDTFHQGQLQRELGQIHMRDVLDQDKREVRLIQELLFEDGDLGGGGRQRKFRWKDIDGVEEMGTIPDEFADTQEEEFESEEQWRKQRHEREMFLKQMQNKDESDESLNVSVNRTTIIKANLCSKTMSSLLLEVNGSSTAKTDSPAEKKTAKDIPSPKKPFALFQQSYQGSLLSRGRGALARLAALATPLATDDDSKVGTLGPTSRRNFVFATITPDKIDNKVKKRKAEANPSTPKLVKKMKAEEKNISKSSLLDHLNI